MNTDTDVTKGHKRAAGDDRAAGAHRTRRSLLPLGPVLRRRPLRRPQHLPAAGRRERKQMDSRASLRSPIARAPQAEQMRR